MSATFKSMARPALARLGAAAGGLARRPGAALGAAAALGLGLAAIRLLRTRHGRRRTGPLRVAFVHAEDAEKWADQMQLYVRAFDSERAFEWREYKAWLCELPKLDEVDAIMVSGSRHNVTDAAEKPWLTELLAFLTRAAAEERVQLVGICFGCQAIASALGGSVGPNECGTFAYGVERLWPAPAYDQHPAVVAAREDVAAQLALAGTSLMPAAPRVLESHGQCVLTLPPAATLLASTSTAVHELFSVGRHVLCLQSHPEFSPPLLEQRIAPALLASRTLSAEEHREAGRRFAREYDAEWANEALFMRALVTAHLRAGH